jgi:DNA polymerase I
LPELIKPETGRIHTSYNQAITATGRLSSTNPNLQNIPIRTDKGRFIRKAFVPRNNDYTLLSADYSQIELRIIASISKDEAMIESFKQNIDIHSTTAAKIFNVPLDAVTAEMRRKAKVVNFGIIYGISGWGLAERMGISRKEADEIINQYFIKFPGIKQYMDDTIKFARENGYVQTLLGRKRFIRDINTRNQTQKGFAERNAINAPIQGSAADMIKIAMVEIDKKIIAHKFSSKMILQVHDELVFDCLKTELDVLKKIVKEEMEKALPLDVPVYVEMGSGENWLDAH